MLIILSKFVPSLISFTYHYKDYKEMFELSNFEASQLSFAAGIKSNPWVSFRNISTLFLSNIIGTELVRVLKSIGGQLLELAISNIGLWNQLNILRQNTRHGTPQGDVHEECDIRINLFTLGLFAPKLKRLCLEMCHFTFNQKPNCLSFGDDNHFDKATAQRQRFSLQFLKDLQIKGVDRSSSNALKEFLCRCYLIEELILLTKPQLLGNNRRRFDVNEEYELCKIITDDMLLGILRQNPLSCLKVFIASTVEPCLSGCKLQLTKKRYYLFF